MTSFLKSDIDEIASNLGELKQSFAGKRILITGGCGFLGKYFTETFFYLNKHFLKDPCEVVVLDNLITSHQELSAAFESKNFVFVNHDIIKPFYPERPVDFILHAAGIASPYYYRKFPLETLDVATTGLRNVLDLAKQYPGCKLSFFSSSEIYGDPDPKHVPIKESYRGNVSSLGARACYDESKRLGETLIRIYHEHFGIHATIIRPFNVIGPGMSKNDYRVLPNFGAKIMADEPLQIYGDGSQTRTFCYITDAINGFLRVLVNGIPGEPYNIGNPVPEISMVDLAKQIGEILNKEVKFDLVEYPDSYPGDEPLRRCPDITKAKLQLEYEPKVILTDALKRFFSWASVNYK